VHGGFILALGAANTITWRLNEDARAEALRASAEFRSAFDDAPTGMVLTSLDGHIERVNATFLTVTGHEGEDLTGRPLSDFASHLRHGGDEVTFTLPTARPAGRCGASPSSATATATRTRSSRTCSTSRSARRSSPSSTIRRTTTS
jgi:PAS domain-containing protein